MTRVLLGISGSISAYKAADIANELTKRQIEVDVLMTKNSQAFITPLTLQTLTKRSVHTEVMTESQPHFIHHIELAKQADLLVISPASGNIIGKLANGIADDLLSTVALACHNIPKVVAPAMNTQMYEHPAVQRNLRILQEDGFQIVDPRESLLACGDYGKGALATVEDIIQHIVAEL